MKLVLALSTVFLSATVSAKTIEIKMLNAGKEGAMVFEPSFVKADVGDSVKFVPVDKAHNSHAVFVPQGAKAWNGKMDEAITAKLDKEGVYIYQCDPHAVMGMFGVIQVGKATNLAAAQSEAQKIAAKTAVNKERITKAVAQAK